MFLVQELKAWANYSTRHVIVPQLFHNCNFASEHARDLGQSLKFSQ